MRRCPIRESSHFPPPNTVFPEKTDSYQKGTAHCAIPRRELSMPSSSPTLSLELHLHLAPRAVGSAVGSKIVTNVGSLNNCRTRCTPP